MKKFFKILAVVSLLAIFGFWYIEQRIEKALDYLQANIEKRALPVLQQDIPILNKSFMGIPSAQSILGYIKLGPLSPSKITQRAVGFVEKPLINMKLERTKEKLNRELGWVKVNSLDFKRDGKYKTLTAHCSYGITVIITGKKFKSVTSRNRRRLTLTFRCD